MQSVGSVLWNLNVDLFFQSQGYKGQPFLGAGQWQSATALHQPETVRVNSPSELLVDPVARPMFSRLGTPHFSLCGCVGCNPNASYGGHIKY